MSGRETILYLNDFISDESEKNDYTPVFRRALAACNTHDSPCTLFVEAGRYPFRESVTHQTFSIAHDDGCGDIDKKDCHIYLCDVNDITIRGEIDERGEPTSIFCGYNHGRVQSLMPSILWIENCKKFRLENIAFSREPDPVCAGLIEAVTEKGITIHAIDNNHHYDGMAAYCMNRFTSDGTLSGASLSYGFDFDVRWRSLGNQRYFLDHPDIASRVHCGEILSWHQAGKTDFLLFFGDCENLSFKNIRIQNSNAFAILTQNCRHINAEQLVIKPKPGRYFCGPRDGWKIYRCNGDIRLHQCHIEGVRMDGQNVHANYLFVEKILNGDELLCVCKYAPIALETGSVVRFYQKDGMTFFSREIEQWEVVERRIYRYKKRASDPTASVVVPNQRNWETLYRIRFKTSPQHQFALRQQCIAECWLPRNYQCTDSIFRNIAGAGQLLRCENIEIQGCRYENIMNAGILLGAELSTHNECGHVAHAHIHQNSFSNCGFHPRYGRYGKAGIAIKSQGFDRGTNYDIHIHHNRFIRCETGIEASNVKDLRIHHNIFEQVETDLVVL